MPEPTTPPGAGEVTLATGSEGFGAAETQAGVLGIRAQTQFGDVRRRFLRNKLAVVGWPWSRSCSWPRWPRP